MSPFFVAALAASYDFPTCFLKKMGQVAVEILRQLDGRQIKSSERSPFDHGRFRLSDIVGQHLRH